ncbi:50S ribosomal protein L10 [Mycoplasmopsis cynos]|uniref:Large ribosomal subunit protein uL10 n=2 Tax=Mycoplasmopsis cynos TaxID=171284 RepID=L0RWP7_MYCC1|nr:50S ribosomal protein L10 [Mycoplasmopsis cynos]TQC54649.1 50S ribosomal protein L10 [Mycoplasmopsis cynos]WQQ13388.1 50S ribosomal protein L10 [Mycoplasmopsis cynos]WQQ13664.1 50S ribosomal protein L10 [Mycoplasmopsis cynos]WQQ15399.1 50S ribosomal protein L10 [Mycoplasmopsis cynos]WQQ17145.1 50S ribosomal protein L10 [Mycoplasmopsis cynos]
MTESKFKIAKREVVLEISQKIKNSQALAFAEYRGLTVAELEEFRSEAAKVGVDVKVYKNRLFKIAAANNGLADLSEYLVGPNIFLFSENDGMAAAKLLSSFAKKHKIMVIKAGTYEGKVLDANGVKEVATLPTYEEALAILARSMMSPLQQLGLALKMYSEGKTE